MTQDFFLGQLRIIAIAFVAYATGRGWLSSADGTLIGAILPPVGLVAGPWLWSIYTNVNKKLVPHDSIAISPETVKGVATANGKTTVISTDAAKVVGALLLSILLSSFAAEHADAQVRLTGNPKVDFAIPSPAPKPATTLDAALQNFNDGVQKIEKSLVDKGIADLNAAITDATNHNDNISLPCWKANLALLQSLPSQWPEPPTLPMGIALSIQIQRDLLNSITGNDATSLKVACAALIGDQIKIVANVGALIGIRIGTAGLL